MRKQKNLVMGSESKFSVVQSIDDNELIFPGELGNFGESETKLNSNGGYHVEDVDHKVFDGMKSRGTETVGSVEGVGSSSAAVVKPRGLRKWRRIPRDLVKKTGSNLNSRENGDLTVSTVPKAMVNVNGDYRVQPFFDAVGASGMRNEVSNLNGRSSDLPDDQERNGGIGPGKKPRGFNIEKENLNSTMGSESQSFKSVFVQGGNTVESKGRQSGMFGKYDAESSEDAHYEHIKEEARIEFTRSDTESDDVSLTADGIRKQEESVDQDPLVESVRGLHFAQAGFEREVQKLRDVGKDDELISDDPLHEVLEFKDAKILELESVLNSGDIKTKLEDQLMKIIQTEVEYVVITTATKVLTEGPLREIKHVVLQQNNISSHAKEQQDEKLETKEDLKKLRSRVCKFTSCFIIMLILLFVTLYLQFSPQSVEVVLIPT